ARATAFPGARPNPGGGGAGKGTAGPPFPPWGAPGARRTGKTPPPKNGGGGPGKGVARAFFTTLGRRDGPDDRERPRDNQGGSEEQRSLGGKRVNTKRIGRRTSS